MAHEWYYTENGQQKGPVSDAQLKQLADAGKLKPDDLIWRDGLANWEKASSIKVLFSDPKQPALAKPAPAPEKPKPAAEPAAAATMLPTRVPLGKAEARAVARASGASDSLDLHPLLVLVLTVFTAGLFGLYYAYLANRGCAVQVDRATDSAGRPLGKARHPIWVLMLSYVTLGIYWYYWLYAVTGECVAYTGRRDINPRAELVLMLIFPPYALFVLVFRLPDMIHRARSMAGLPEHAAVRNGYLFLNPCLLPAVPFLNMIEQDALNQVWLAAP